MAELAKDYPDSNAALAAALRWALALPPSSEIEAVTFGQRRVDDCGFYWYAVTYQRYQNGVPQSVPCDDAERDAERVRKVTAAWTEGLDS